MGCMVGQTTKFGVLFKGCCKSVIRQEIYQYSFIKLHILLLIPVPLLNINILSVNALMPCSTVDGLGDVSMHDFTRQLLIHNHILQTCQLEMHIVCFQANLCTLIGETIQVISRDNEI